jgi:hypothetical protein
MRVTCNVNLIHYILHTEGYVQTSLHLLVTEPWLILFFKRNEQISHALDRGVKYQFVRNSVLSPYLTGNTSRLRCKAQPVNAV